MGYRALNTIVVGMTVVLTGCHHQNPDYLPGARTTGDSTGPAATNGPDITSMDSVDSMISQDGPGMTASVTNTNGDGPMTTASTESDGTTTMAESGESSSGGGGICPSQANNPINIAVELPMGGGSWDCNGLNPAISAMIQSTGSWLELTPCIECPSGCGPMPTILLAVDGVPPIEGEGQCATLYPWTEDGGEACDGVALALEDEMLPVYIAANTRTVTTPFFNFTVDLSPPAACPAEIPCTPDEAGDYSFSFAPERDVGVGPAQQRMLPIAGGTTYLFDNRMSYIDSSCDEHMAWVATLPGG